MTRKILIISLLLFSIQLTYSQTNLLSKSKQDFIYDDSIKNFVPLTEKTEVLNSFAFIKEPAILKISEVSSTPIIEKKYSILSVEDDKKNDTINFTIKDKNNIEYTLMLSVAKSKIVIIHVENNKTYLTDYKLVIP